MNTNIRAKFIAINCTRTSCKFIVVLLFLTSFLCAGETNRSATNQPAAKLIVTPEVVDFREFREGQLRKRQISVTNKTNDEIIIEQAGSGCPCLQVKLGKRNIATNEQIQVIVELNSLGLIDKQDRKITLVCREKTTDQTFEQEIPVKGLVKRAPAQLAIYPEAALFGNIITSEKRETDIVIFNLSSKPLKLEGVDSRLPALSCELPENPLIPSGLYKKIKIIIDGEKLVAGPLESEVILSTDFPLHNTIKIPVRATVRNSDGSTMPRHNLITDETVDTF